MLGSAIWDTSPVTISDSVISGNTGTGGAGGDATGAGSGGDGGDVLAGAVGPATVTMTNTKVTGNSETGGNGGSSAAAGGGAGGSVRGAAITASGLTITDSMVSDNAGTGGNGGVASAPTRNGGDGGGAEAAIFDQSALSITTTTVSGNQTSGGNGGASTGTSGKGGASGGGAGGGINVSAGGSPPVSIASSVISGNSISSGTPGDDVATLGQGGNAAETDGGGVFIGAAGTTSITGTTFSGNQVTNAPPGNGAGSTSGLGAATSGGGLAIDVPSTVVNSTVFGNTVRSQSGATGGEYSEGGGVASLAPGATIGLYSDTIVGNSVPASPAIQMAGANIGTGGGIITLADTVIASPLPSGAPNCYLAGPLFSDSGHNLEDTTPSTCGLSVANHDVIGSSPQLASALGANGGTAGPTDSTGYTGTFTLAPAVGSPLIGAGGQCVNPLASGSPPLTVDQRGFSRPATCDIGAFQTQPLQVTGAPAITGTPTVGHPLTCGTGTLATTGDGAFTATGAIGAPALTYGWTSGGATLATTSSYTPVASDAGHSITCTLTATGAYGHGSATSPAVDVATAPPSPPPPTSVVLSAVGQAHKTWAEKKRKRRHKTPIGTSFKFTLNEAATVKLTFTTTLKGRKVKHKCVAQTKRNKRAPKCTTIVTARALTVAGKAGANTVPFTGKIGSRRLKPGRYKVTITATSGTSTSSQTLSFTIVK